MSLIIPYPKKTKILSDEKHSLPLHVSADPVCEKATVALTELFPQIFEVQPSQGCGDTELIYDGFRL